MTPHGGILSVRQTQKYSHNKESKMFGTSTLKKLAITALIAAGLNFVGCMEQSSGASAGNTNNQTTALHIRIGVDPVRVLAKTNTISLSKMIVVLTSNTSDTIRDTITSSTTPSLSATSTSAQTITKDYTLKPLRTWKLVATTKDLNDSVIHIDSATTPVLYAADTANVSLSLSSRFTMYDARFLTIPDSINSAVVGTSKQVLHLNRLVLKVDGVTKVDSTVAPGPYFTALATAVLSYDYVTVGSHSIQLLAYGPMYSWNTANPLFSGTQTINVGAGLDSTVAMTLAWVGPTTGTGHLSAVIGKVGKVTVNSTLPGTVIP